MSTHTISFSVLADDLSDLINDFTDFSIVDANHVHLTASITAVNVDFSNHFEPAVTLTFIDTPATRRLIDDILEDIMV